MAQRGGRRSGTPGVGYSNRTDLLTQRAPQTGQQTAAAGAQAVPSAPVITPDMVPKLNDPTARPNEPVTAGLMNGPGPGPEVMGFTPTSPIVQKVQAAYLRNPTPELRKALDHLASKGAL